MEATRYILRSLVHYRFAYLGVFLGAVLGALVLLGSLFAGDSVKESLLRISEQRTGQATHLLSAGDRFFREALAVDLASEANARTAPVVYLRGTAVQPSTQAIANQVQLIGVTDAFWQFAPEPTDLSLTADGTDVAVNAAIANQLSLSVGDALIVRFEKPGVLSGNAPVAGADSSLESFRCTVAAIVGDGSFGRFNLESTQVPRPSVYLPIGLLQQRFELTARANLLLIDASNSETDLEAALATVAQLGDYGLKIEHVEQAGALEIASDRIFIDPEIGNALTTAIPEAQPVVSYLVNEFRIGDRTTPYSIAAATTSQAASFLPVDLGDDEIVLNDWLADDLQATPGNEIRLTYYQAGDSGALVESSRAFRVRTIVALAGLAADGSWMPDFPGISEADTPDDWDAGLPLDLSLIRDKDEDYWDEYRGAPKAFLSIDAGREIWSNRWGEFTALRVPGGPDEVSVLTAKILGALRPEMNQLLLTDFRATAMENAQSPVSFGGLFIGMSFFLILAALGLVTMLFQFCLLLRNRESALLGSVGLPAKKLVNWRIGEATIVLVLGALLALPLAMVYTRGILRFLETIWAGQSTSPTFVFYASPVSMVTGGLVFVAFSLVCFWIVLRKLAKRSLSIRLTANAEESGAAATGRGRSVFVAVLFTFIGVAALAMSGSLMPAQGAFYLAGFALLIAGLAICRLWLGSGETPDVSADFNARRLGQLNLKSRRSRSLTVVGLIASAVFMVLSVASFRKHVGDEWRDRASGTGGFAFWIETTAAQNQTRDGASEGFEIFQNQRENLAGMVPIRTGAGDNANCFNLNTTAQPKLLAVDPSALAERGAFSVSTENGWLALNDAPTRNLIPALVDQTTLMWALKRKVGDILTYSDENGRQFEVQIVGTVKDSIFQGYLVLDEQRFLEKFPSNPGFSIFLADVADDADVETVRGALERSVADAGGRVVVTRDVLQSFHEIENTYIAIFNVLGTLGVVLGSLGLAIVVARSIQERRGEFAVMLAIGIPRKVLGAMVFSEYRNLVLWGLLVGGVASLLSVWPNLDGLPAVPTIILVAALLLGIVVLNLVCGWLVFRRSFKGFSPRLELLTR